MKTPRLVMPDILKKAEKAMKAAVHQVMVEHKEKGLPIFIWQHNKVVRVPARRIHTR